ncbi:penicillin-binding protein activator [Neptuniibacter caesariensis]|uniref:Penicillin-binding protein activator n=1 Tax=Neptuniibacter caesariensis TaxID=207954 RepID=A0A7U8GR13_NEPCE|nr:penicillin-binding protein activator [Neptuniibacter caesariensis]EAR59728.1 hypothetical protein MED92_15875 [Oceanospirillum sp. MED92] [Neptuniibacter caesariensis]
MKFQWRLSLSAIVISAIITGCSVPTSVTQPPQTTAERNQSQVDELLTEADKSKPIKAAQLKAQAAQLLLQMGKQSDAAFVLEQIDVSLLPPTMRFDIAKLQAEASISQSRPEKALDQLDRFASSNQTQLLTEQEASLLRLRAEAFRLQNEIISEINALIRLSTLLETEAAKQQLHDEIWQKLLTLDPETVSNRLRAGTNTYFEQGWLELINELSSNKQLDSQHQAISNWAQLWEAHPARSILPTPLKGLSQETLSVNKIAVLLPFEGKLAKPAQAIKEGIMMAHFRSQAPGRTTPELLFLDSGKINTPVQLAAILKELNADLVIGPLTKEYVASLATDSHISTPILALNYTDAASREGLYQFGLSAEDEAEQIAQKLIKDGASKAAVLTPASNWGKKIADAFSEHYSAMGGKVVTRDTFGETSEFSSDISRFLSTDASKERYKKVRQLVYTRKIEFEEHRRQDIDAIVLTALPNDARQILPILAFNFAGDLPVYATSHLHSGSADPIQDQDLNKVQFLDTPWSLKPPSQDKILISQQRANTTSRFGRLYALGLDAYRIHPYLQQLGSLPNAEIQGETGTLSIDQTGKVTRTLLWATYKEGIPQITE